MVANMTIPPHLLGPHTPGQLCSVVTPHPALYTPPRTLAPHRNPLMLVLLTYPALRILHPAFYTYALDSVWQTKPNTNKNC